MQRLAASIPWLPVLAAAAFAAAHTQSPLYYSNQNQYFLHGLAQAGYGDLSSDWLANTREPTPLFSAVVEITHRTVGAWGFQAIYFGLLMTYFLSLWSAVAALPFAPRTTAGRLAFAAGLISIHSAIMRVLSVQLLGVDYPWYFHAGVANQYVLGTGLQPSAFGVFLLTALAAAVRGRPLLAASLCAMTCAWHSTYLLPAGLIVLGLLVGLARERRWQTAIATGSIALIGVLPVLVYNAIVFAPTSSESFDESQRLLAWVRIPHHADVNRWFDWVAGVQLSWASIGLVLFRRTRLSLPLAVAVGGALGLTLVQIITADASLALAFPWRLSAVLVPLATAAVLAFLANRVEQWNQPLIVSLLASGTIAIALVGAVVVTVRQDGYQESHAEDKLLAFVASTHRPGELYLLPTGFPKPPTKRGTGANTFVPVKQSPNPTTFELARFRLKTGAATFVDFKSVPYQDGEVLEWHRRVSVVADWYAVADWDESGIADRVVAEGVTHVVVPGTLKVKSIRFEATSADPAYRVYRVR